MSKVDANLGMETRDGFLHEVRTHLPAFLSPAAVERTDVLGDVTELLNLRRSDLRKVVAAHLGLSDPVSRLIQGLHQGLRSPITSTQRPRLATQAVRGPIDWGSTIRSRAVAGGDHSVYVVRPARRVFDTPENRALAWILERLDTELRHTAPAEIDKRAGVHDSSWFAHLVEVRARLQLARKHHWLRGVTPERPTARTRQSLRAARTTFYKVLVPDAIEALERLTESPTADDLTALLCQRYFEPGRDWQLFEVVVALRLARAFAEASDAKRKSRLLVGTGRAPYARYLMPNGDEIGLWYQAWPDDTGHSLHDDARRHYRINAGGARPDIVLQRYSGGACVDALLLELKASRSGSTLSGGLMQLLSYLKDRPNLFAAQPSGWLVALPSEAFASTAAGGRELWAIDSSTVADAAVARFA